MANQKMEAAHMGGPGRGIPTPEGGFEENKKAPGLRGCMLERRIVGCCAPTLAGMKAGSLFSYKIHSGEALAGQLRACSQKIRRKGICLLPLCAGEGSVLVYACRPRLLRRELEKEGVSAFLASIGYRKTSLSYCIKKLRKRLAQRAGFPHEMGLFLGYPLEDVEGFISNAGKNCKACGCWKVYGDERAAARVFEKYKKCKRIYDKLYAKGYSIARLTVAV